MFEMLQRILYLTIFIIFFGESSYAKPSKFMNAYELGVGEKGVFLNLIKNLTDKNQLNFGLHYFDGNVSSIDYSLNESVPIFFSSKGIQFSFKHFLKGSVNKSGLFAQAGLDFSSLNASAVIDLGNQIYDSGDLTLTCRTCGEITVSNKNNFQFIPSILLGLQKRINDNFTFTIAAGIQYLKFSNVEWEKSNEISFPSYVNQKINSITENANQELDKYGNLIPTFKISTTYHF